MPAINTNASDNDTTTVRIPKLAVRNRVVVDDDIPANSAPGTTLHGDNGSTRPPLSTRSSEQTVSTVRERRGSNFSQDTRVRSRQDVDAERKDVPARKKKSGGVLGFLTLKEPSTNAWEEYAQQQKKKAAEKGVKVSAVGTPGVSSQKLPVHVPKVNSKWDGLPENAQRKSEELRASKKSHRSSVMSTSTLYSNRSGPSSRSDSGRQRSPGSRFGSLSSRPSCSTVAHSKHNSVQSTVSSMEPKRVSYRSPTTSSVHPALRDNNHLRNESSFLHSPTPPPFLPEIVLAAADPGTRDTRAATGWRFRNIDVPRTHQSRVVASHTASGRLCVPAARYSEDCFRRPACHSSFIW